MTKNISVANDFTPFPFGRYRAEGKHSGEAFREDVLWPLLERGEGVQVNLDGVLGGLGSSFLEEAFAGLLRVHRIPLHELQSRLRIVSKEDANLVRRTWEYIERAATRQQ